MSARTIQLTEPVRDYLLSVGVREDPALVALREETKPLESAMMQICPEQGAFMAMIVKLLGARRILEVGTFTGYSALAMALAMGRDGHITCCDVSEEWTAIGRRHWDAAGVGDRIDLRLAPALDTIAALREGGGDGTFDLVFVDADKTNYLAYHEACLPLLRAGGALLFDNVLWSGSAADATDERESTRAIRELNAFLATDDRIDLVMLPIGDGLTIARKR